MLGSAQSISDPNVVLNTALAEVLSYFADKLEGKKEVEAAARRLIRDSYAAHKRIVFNGNNYSDEWKDEAARRGLLNLPTTADAIPHLTAEKNIALFEKMGIFSETEVRSRCEIMLESYCKILRIEGRTMVEMADRQLLPAVIRCGNELAEGIRTKEAVGIPADGERTAALELEADVTAMRKASGKLRAALAEVPQDASTEKQALYYKEEILTAMQDLRRACDRAEGHTAADMWPIPTYGELLFYAE